jgi:hypothetical protein
MSSGPSIEGSRGMRQSQSRRWFGRVQPRALSADQEAEVRDRLYARPDPNERTVELVGPARRIAERPAA